MVRMIFIIKKLFKIVLKKNLFDFVNVWKFYSFYIGVKLSFVKLAS